MKTKIIIDNMNFYFKEIKIKQTTIARRSNFDVNKVSRILSGANKKTTLEDLTKLAEAVGKQLDFFTERFIAPKIENKIMPNPHFYLGEATEETKKLVKPFQEFADRVYYLHSLTKENVMIQDEF